jgi:hypothetical protein
MKKEEILALCLQEIQSGRSTLAECLTRYPELEGELRDLLEIATRIKADTVKPSPEFKLRARRRLFEVMEASTPDTRKAKAWTRPAPVRAIAISLAALLGVGLAGGGTVLAAQGALPGDALYSVKTGFENFQLALTPAGEAKANLRLDIARKRIEEAAREVDSNRNVNIQALQSVQTQLDGALKEIGKTDNSSETNKALERYTAATLDQQLDVQGVLARAPESSQKGLEQTLDNSRRANLISQAAQSNSDFLKSQPSVADPKLDGSQFDIQGTFSGVQNGFWTVGRVKLQKVHFNGATPAAGSLVIIEGVVKDGESFITRLQTEPGQANAPTKIEGQVNKVEPDGAASVGGVPVKIAGGKADQLKKGDQVRLQGDAADSQLNVTGHESQPAGHSTPTSIKGVLKKVDSAHTTITVSLSGSLIIIDVGKARLQNDSGKALKTSDLAGLVGHNVNVTNLTKDGKAISAGGVVVR